MADRPREELWWQEDGPPSCGSCGHTHAADRDGEDAGCRDEECPCTTWVPEAEVGDDGCPVIVGTAPSLRSHPCFDRCVSLYRNGLIDWNASGAIQQAAATLGMDRRAYCDARLSANQFQWTATRTGEPFTAEHVELAWRIAVEGSGVRT